MGVDQPFPRRIPVTLERYTDGTVNEMGNPEPGYDSAESWLVVGIEPPISSEPLVVGHDRVVIDAKMYAPISMAANPRDRVTVRDRPYEVVGYPAEADMGPWWDLQLATVLLKAVEG